MAAVLYVGRSAPAGRQQKAGAARRRELRVQIAALERALAELEAEHPEALHAAGAARRAEEGPRLLGARDLEGVRADLLRQLAALQIAIDGGGGDDPGAPRQAEASREKRAPASRAKRSAPRTSPSPA